MDRFYDFSRIGLSVLLAPFLVFTLRHSQRLHKNICRLLITGPHDGPLVEKIQDAIYAFEKGDQDAEGFISGITDEMTAAVSSGELDAWLEQSVRPDEDRDIVLSHCFGYSPLKWWYLKLHFMAPGNVHGLHAHRNVLSTQVVARGKLRVQEYDLVGEQDDDPVQLRFRRDEVVGPVQGFYTTDRVCNVHGFEPAGEPAVRFQFYLRGHNGIWAMLKPKRGRLYVEPIWDSREGDMVLAKLGEPGRRGES